LPKPWESVKIILTDKQVTSARNIITIYVKAVLPAVTRNYTANLGLLVLSSSRRRRKKHPAKLKHCRNKKLYGASGFPFKITTQA
jgi:hypothetical protein